MDSLKLINFMENLRYDRKISQENYLHGIISQRQYYRYRVGESEVPFDVITKFADKLNIPIPRLLEQFDEGYSKENDEMLQFFYLVSAKDIKEADLQYKKMKLHTFISRENENFFKCSKMVLDLYAERLQQTDFVVNLKKMIDYPKVMKKSAFPDDEIYMLGLLMEYSEKDRKKVLAKLYEVLQNRGQLFGGNVSAEYRVYFWMIKHLGRNEQYNEVIEMCDIVLEKSEQYYMHYLHEYYHYYKALAHHRLNEQEAFEHHLVMAILNLEHRSTQHKQKFYEQIIKDTGINPVEFAIKRFSVNSKYINNEETK